jgi:hypothetical protein
MKTNLINLIVCSLLLLFSSGINAQDDPICVPPDDVTITQPTDESGCVGGDVTFDLEVSSGNGDLSYNWEVSTNGGTDWNDVPDTNEDLVLNGVSSGMNGNMYRCWIEFNPNGGGNGDICDTLSAEVTLTVLDNPSCAITDNNSGPHCPGTTGLTFSGPGSVDTYSWSVSGDAAIVGSSTSSSVTVTAGTADFNVMLETTKDNSGTVCTSSPTCSVSVDVDDTENPVAICQDVTVDLNGAGNGSTTPAAINNNSTDNCDNDLSLSLDDASFNCSDVPSAMINLTVTDDFGNTSSCSATVTVNDNENPVAICQNITVNLNASGNGTTTPANVNNNSTDNCDTDLSLSLNDAAFNCNDIPATVIELTVTDDSGNTSSCTSTVTVVDNIDPSFTCPGNQTINLDGNCQLLVPDLAGQVSNEADNCGIPTMTQMPTSGTLVNSGEGTATVVTVTATDPSGNDTDCTVTLTGDDVIEPTFSCDDTDINVSTNQSCGINVIDVTDKVSNLMDNCTSSGQINVTQIPTAGTSQTGGTDVTISVDDGNGNIAMSCVVSLIAVDDVPPNAECKNNPSFTLTSAGTLTLQPDDIDDGSNDFCDQTPDLEILGNDFFNCNSVADNPHTVTLRVTDDNGNSATCTSSVTIVIGALDFSVAVDPNPAEYCVGSNVAITAVETNGSPTFTYHWETPTPDQGGDTKTILANQQGVHSVTVTDSQGCTASAVGQVNETTEFNVNITGDPVLCTDAGSTVILDAGEYETYLWSGNANNATTRTVVLNSIGVYSVTVTDIGGCVGIGQREVILNDVIQLDLDPTEPTCNGETNGDITAVATYVGGGSGNFTYQWSANTGNQTTMTATGLGAGNYSVTATDEHMCTASESLLLGEPEPLEVTNLDVDPESCLGDGNGSISFNISGGDAPYQYNITGPVNRMGNTNLVVMEAGLPVGNYMVLITDNSGLCTTQFSFDILAGFQVMAEVTGDNEICQGEFTTFFASGGFAFQWSRDGDILVGETGSSITISEAGLYSVIVTAEGNNNDNCTGEASRQLTVLALPNIDITAPTSICTNIQATITADCDNCSLTTYQWDFEGSTNATINPIVNPPGSQYNVTVTDGNTTCQDTANVFVTGLNIPDALFSTSSLLEEGKLFTLFDDTEHPDGIPTVEWFWTIQDGDPPTSTQQSPTILMTDQGNKTICLTATDDNGCVDNICEEIFFASANGCNVNISGPTTTCTGATELYRSNARESAAAPSDGYTVSWTANGPANVVFDDFAGREVNATFSEPGTYTLMCTVLDDAPGVCTRTDEHTVVVVPTPTGTLTVLDEVYCEGQDVQIQFQTSDQGNIDYSIIYNIGGSNLTIDVTNNFVFPLTGVNDTVNLEMTSITNKALSSCATMFPDPVQVPINIIEALGLVPLDTECNPSGTTVLEQTFQITGGTAPYMTNNGTVFEDTITLVNVPDSVNQVITISDNGVCPDITEEFIPSCECGRGDVFEGDPFSINIPNGPIFCADEQVQFTFDPTQLENPIDENDIVIFVLHQGAGSNIVNQLTSFSSEGTFNINTNVLVEGQQYFISPVVTSEELGLDDECRAVGRGTSFSYRNLPEPGLIYDDSPLVGETPEIDLCANQQEVQFETFNLPTPSASIASFEWTINGGSNNIRFPNLNNDPQEDIAFITLSNNPGGMDVINFRVNEIVDATGPGKVCAGNETVIVNLVNGVALNKTPVVWWPGNLLVSDMKGQCYNWAFFQGGIFTTDVPNNDDYFFLAPENEDLLNEAFPKKYFVDIWSPEGGNCPPYETVECYTRSYFNVKVVPIRIQTDIDDNKFKVYPNPFFDRFNIEVSGAWGGVYKMRIFDGIGQMKYSKELVKENIYLEESIDVSNLVNGMYYIILENEQGQRKIQKIIKSAY